jgi:hypothetical protein
MHSANSSLKDFARNAGIHSNWTCFKNSVAVTAAGGGLRRKELITMFEINFKHADVDPVTCAICGEAERPENTTSHIYRDGIELGYVCRSCESKTRDELAGIALSQAKKLDEKAKFLRDLAESLRMPEMPVHGPARYVESSNEDLPF